MQNLNRNKLKQSTHKPIKILLINPSCVKARQSRFTLELNASHLNFGFMRAPKNQ